MIVQRVCAWCNKDMGQAAFKTSNPRYNITHGICQSCKNIVQRGGKIVNNRSIHGFLNRFEIPVFLVDSYNVVKTTNYLNNDYVNKPFERIVNLLGGDAFECIHYRKHGSCGNSSHCAVCVINKSIIETINNGSGVIKKVAEQDVLRNSGIETQKILITTEKVGDVVFLQIDHMETIEQCEHPEKI